MPGLLPEVIHTYQNHLLDSTRWRRFVPRSDDIVITTSLKSGTTWTQSIVAYLVLGSASIPDINAVSPWLDRRGRALDEVLAHLDAQQHRRFIKSHLPLDGLPFHTQIKYIVVGRDARDVFMSLWNHHTRYTDDFVKSLNATPGRVGPPMPPPQQEIHAFWRNWITKGWFDWECEGYPYWGNLHHTKTWWPYRTLDNILFVHFNDLLSDLAGEIRRIARFLEIGCPDQTVADVARMVAFSTMRQNAEQLLPNAGEAWHGGSTTFVFKGTNGRWKDVLSPEELALHAETVAKVLEPDCAVWLEHGRIALAAPTFAMT
jgi:aryl sulfotransferase